MTTTSTQKKSLKQIRQEAGLSGQQLAGLADVSLSTINRMEKGQPPVKLLTAGRVIHALGQHIGRNLTFDDIGGLQIIPEETAEQAE